MSDQDGIASIPKWLRKLFIKLRLTWLLAMWDEGGKYHDPRIEKNGFNRATIKYIAMATWNWLASTILTPIKIVAVAVGALVPPLRTLYFKIIE